MNGGDGGRSVFWKKTRGAIRRPFETDLTNGRMCPKGESDDFSVRLGIDSSASREEIVQAYRKLAKQYHPDSGGDADHFRLLQEAYESLIKTHPAEKSSNQKPTSASESRPNESARDQKKESSEEFPYEKPTVRKNRETGMDRGWVDGLSDSERNKYRMLNRLARENGLAAPYPEADKETVSEFLRRAVKESQEQVDEILRTREKRHRERSPASARGTTSGAQSNRASNTSRHDAFRQAEFLTNNLRKQQDSIGYWYIVDANGNRVAKSYKSLQAISGHVIGADSLGHETLIDSETGKELSRFYRKIRTEGDVLLGVDSIQYERVLDAATGKELSRSYGHLRAVGSYLIGTDSIGYETLVDPKTGRELSRPYTHITFVNGRYEGETSIGRREVIKVRR